MSLSVTPDSSPLIPHPDSRRFGRADDDAGEAAALRAASKLPRDVVRLQGGMGSLGSFIGTDDFVRSSVAAAVADETVDGIANGKRPV